MHVGISRRRFAGGAVLASAISFVPIGVRGAQFSWKWGSDWTTEDPVNVRAIEAFAKMRKDTGGQLDIRAFPASALGTDPSVLNQLRLGAIETYGYSGANLDTFVPVASIEGIAFSYPNLQTAYKAMDGELGAVIRGEIVAKGIMVLDKVFDAGFRNFTSSLKPLRSVADAQGMKLRVSPSKLRVDTFRSLGMVPTPLSAAEMYTSMQTKIVDGQESSLTTIESFKLYEVQKYCSITNHIWSGNWNLVNMDKWNSLGPQLQKVLRDGLNEAVEKQRRDTQLLSQAVREKLVRQGMIFNEPAQASFRQKLVESGFYGRWREAYGEKAWTALEKYAGTLPG